MFVDEMPEGELIDYLMASARVPGLNRQGPKDGKFLDGGVYDNTPIGILRKRGINRLIVVDISGIKGIGHKEALSCANIVYIRPFDAKELGESFEFDKEATERRIKMGYLDTKKAFGRLFGQFYYFSQKEYKAMQEHYGYEAVNELETLALEYELPRLTVYTERKFLRSLKALINKKDALPSDEEEDEEKKSKLKKAAEVIQETPQILLKKFSIYTRNKNMQTRFPCLKNSATKNKNIRQSI